MTDLAALLAASPLPAVDGDKRERGTVVIVAGAPSCPGAAVLSAVAALRAGAGRVQVVTDPSLCTTLGVALPEALVLGWAPGAPVPGGVAERLEAAAAVLVGPGLEPGAEDHALAVAEVVPTDAPLLLDARALPAAARLAARHPLVLPNPAEAVALAGQLALAAPADPGGGGDAAPGAMVTDEAPRRPDDEQRDLERLAAGVHAALGAPVAVRGERTVVVDGDGCWVNESGDAGLGTAGSGDVLVGLAVGLLGRGLAPLAAIAWAIGIHASAGALLGRGRPNPGYLARELLDVVPDALTRTGPFRVQGVG